MLVVMLGWVIFRSNSLQEAGSYLTSMFNVISNPFFSDYTYMFLKEFWIFFIAAILFSLPIASIANQFMAKGILIRKNVDLIPPFKEHSVYVEAPFVRVMSILYPLGMVLLFLICVAYMVKGSYNPFIYFQF